MRVNLCCMNIAQRRSLVLWSIFRFLIVAVVILVFAWPVWEHHNFRQRMSALRQITVAGGDVTAKCSDEDFDGLKMRSWLRRKMAMRSLWTSTCRQV